MYRVAILQVLVIVILGLLRTRKLLLRSQADALARPPSPPTPIPPRRFPYLNETFKIPISAV